MLCKWGAVSSMLGTFVDKVTNTNAFMRVMLFGALALASATTMPSLASIWVEPFNPRPSDSVTITVDGGTGCVSVDRVERTTDRISIYVVYSGLDVLFRCSRTSALRASVALGALPESSYSVEIVSLDPARPTRERVVSQTAFIVAATNPQGNLPTRIDAIGSVAMVQDPLDDPFGPNGKFQPVLFRVVDAQGRPVAGAPFGYSVVDSTSGIWQSCPHYSISSDCGRSLSGPDGGIAVSLLFGPSQTAGSTFFTWAVSSPSPANPAVSSFVTVGYIDAKRRAQVTPVIEYEVQFRQPFQPLGYFITSSEEEMKLLDKWPTHFRRTYAAFFGVRAGTAGAQPVCRFLKGLPADSRYFHWYTADASECAAKRNDASYVYEGTPFWAYPASASGGCPKDTRGVSRYVYKQNGNVVAVRYSQLNSMRTRAGGSISNDYYTLQLESEGTAFCVPD